MTIDYSLIGERLKKARLAKKLTQENLAEQMNVSVAFLSRIERGSSHINLTRLAEICSILGVSEGYILTGVTSNSRNYLNDDFKKLLSNCSPQKQKLIYNIAKTIAESDID